ncbi:hypothetical protein EDB84DRAFT_1560702 [Lactarius hengduanensis]|nr:hypothetical protein EDB84DRAFT_1571457 [Lactarius hengduanensis]KAH9037145.1 hypothetical protein EDB84DRAFT_1560702 [Lactarius hengduanensis]
MLVAHRLSFEHVTSATLPLCLCVRAVVRHLGLHLAISLFNAGSLPPVSPHLLTLFNISASISTHSHKFWNNKEDLGGDQNGTSGFKACDALGYQLQLGQYTPRTSRFVFDPGGSVLTPDAVTKTWRRLPAQVEHTQRLHRTHVATSITLILADNLIVFDPGGVGYASEPARQRKSQTQ